MRNAYLEKLSAKNAIFWLYWVRIFFFLSQNCLRMINLIEITFNILKQKILQSTMSKKSLSWNVFDACKNAN